MSNRGFSFNPTSSTSNQNQFPLAGNVATSFSNLSNSQVPGFAVPSAPPLSLVPSLPAITSANVSVVGTFAPSSNIVFGFPSGTTGVSSVQSSGTFNVPAAPSASIGISTSISASTGLSSGIQTGTLALSATTFLPSQSLAPTAANPTASSQPAPLNSIRLSSRMAPLTRKDEFLNQPIAQIVDDNMKDQKIERVYMHTLALYRERGRCLRQTLVALSNPSARMQLMSQQNLEADLFLSRFLEQQQNVIAEPVRVAVSNCQNSLRELRTASSLLLTHVRRVADSLAVLGADSRYNAEALQLSLRLKEIPPGLANTITGGQSDQHVIAFFSHLLDMALRELRIAEQMSEHLEEEYQMHIQRSRQTTQENFSMNRFEDQTLALEMLREALLAVACRVQCFKESVQELVDRTGVHLAAEVGDVISRKLMARAATSTRSKSLTSFSRAGIASAEMRRELLALEAYGSGYDAERTARTRHKSGAYPFESSTAALIVASLKASGSRTGTGAGAAASPCAAEPRILRVTSGGLAASPTPGSSFSDRSEPVVYVPVPLKSLSGLTLPALMPQTASPMNFAPSSSYSVQGTAFLSPQRPGVGAYQPQHFSSLFAASQPQAPQPLAQGFGAQSGGLQPSTSFNFSSLGQQPTVLSTFSTFGGSRMPTLQQAAQFSAPSGTASLVPGVFNKNTNVAQQPAVAAGVSTAPSLMVSSLLTPSLKAPVPSSAPSASSAGLLMMPTTSAPFNLKNPKQSGSALAKRHQQS